MAAFDRMRADAKLVYVRNLKPGVVTREEGRIEAIEEHAPGWFNVSVFDGATFSMPGDRLLTVVRR